MSISFEIPIDFSKAIEDVVKKANSPNFIQQIRNLKFLRNLPWKDLTKEYNQLTSDLNTLFNQKQTIYEGKMDQFLKDCQSFQQNVKNFLSNLEKTVQSTQTTKDISALKTLLTDYCQKCTKAVEALDLSNALNQIPSEERGNLTKLTPTSLKQSLTSLKAEKTKQLKQTRAKEREPGIEAQANLILSGIFLCIMIPLPIVLPIITVGSMAALLNSAFKKDSTELKNYKESIQNIESVCTKLNLLEPKEKKSWLEMLKSLIPLISGPEPLPEQTIYDLIDSQVTGLINSITELSGTIVPKGPSQSPI